MEAVRSYWPNQWAAPEWALFGTLLGAGLILLVIWSWLRARVSPATGIVGVSVKVLAIILLVLILAEPMRSETRPEPGANLFLILADDSQSLGIRDPGEDKARGEMLKEALDRRSPWHVRLGQEFDTRRYLFDRRVKAVPDFSELSAAGDSSALMTSLRVVARRYQGRPTAGLLLLTDGNATDIGDELEEDQNLPPIYPVVLGTDDIKKDISVMRVSASQTNFEAAPVSISAEVITHGYAGGTIAVQLLDEKDRMLEEQRVREVADDHPFAVQFQAKPDARGIHFYKVRAFADKQEEQFKSPEKSEEATLANNIRHVMVDRAGGPYRVLYVTGRPNWEFKFLRRAMEDDNEVDLIGLVRIAKREPKFTFRDRDDDTNPLFRGFGADKEQAEQYDEPVLVRLGTENEEELRNGFPKEPDELFRYHALILDDLEADFFTQDQKSLIQQFVSQRGGGFLMLGGQESFIKGGYARTPIGELLPVYAEGEVEHPPAEGYKLVLTRDGWLEPWVRARATEEEETRRLARMPAFQTINRIKSIKPGARVLSQVQSADGAVHPALVVQPFGKGRSAALLIGDLWRWQLRRTTTKDEDLEKSWRQTLRWLVADVPQRVEVQAVRKHNEPSQPVELKITLHDDKYRPLDNASVLAEITPPDGPALTLTAEPGKKTGEYSVTYVPRSAGVYRARIKATAADASEIGERETGWVAEPATEEFRTLQPNRELLSRLAEKTGGEVLELDDLDEFVQSLPSRKVPITEQRINPVWHSWPVFLCALGLLISEWGLRRWKGLP